MEWDSTVASVCKKCLENFRRNDIERQGENFDFAYAPFIYRGIAQTIMNFKHGGDTRAVGFLATFMAESLGDKKFDLLVPVPLFRKRQKERGFNQAELLANEIGNLMGIPLATNIIKRTRKTKPQEKMTNDERVANQKDAYELISAPFMDSSAPTLGQMQSALSLDSPSESSTKFIRNILEGKNILIVDDVITSGATVEEVAKILKKGKPKSINVVAVATVG